MCAKLATLGTDVEVVDVRQLNLPEKGDYVDWTAMNNHADPDSLENLPLLAPSTSDGVQVVCAATLQSKPVKWIWNGWLAPGKLHILAGAPGTGKTTIATDWAASISAGRQFADGEIPEAGDVLIWSGEDSLEETLKPRLEAALGDCSRVFFVQAFVEGGETVPFDPAYHMQRLIDVAAKMPNLRLLIVDPIVAAITGDSHKNAEVRPE